MVRTKKRSEDDEDVRGDEGKCDDVPDLEDVALESEIAGLTAGKGGAGVT